MFLANNFALSDAKNYISELLDSRSIADLPLLRALLAICQKSRQPSFWDVINCFDLLAYANLATSRTLLQ